VKYLVDTNVLSEARRPNGHPAVRRMLTAIAEDDLFLSVITIGEIAHGIARMAASPRRHELEAWLGQIDRHFSERVLPIDQPIARLWGEITAASAKAGRTLHAADGLIAATALHHGLRLLTRNKADFEKAGVLVVDPLDA
jgi:predicted nucleic acid-binding protein